MALRHLRFTGLRPLVPTRHTRYRTASVRPRIAPRRLPCVSALAIRLGHARAGALHSPAPSRRLAGGGRLPVATKDPRRSASGYAAGSRRPRRSAPPTACLPAPPRSARPLAGLPPPRPAVPPSVPLVSRLPQRSARRAAGLPPPTRSAPPAAGLPRVPPGVPPVSQTSMKTISSMLAISCVPA